MRRRAIAALALGLVSAALFVVVASWEGTANDPPVTLAAFALFFVGLVGIVYGAWQLLTGRRRREVE
jgi:hypothetical protein